VWLVRRLAQSVGKALQAQLAVSGRLWAGTITSGVLAYLAVTINARLLGTADFGLLGALVAVPSFAVAALRPINIVATIVATHLATGAASNRALRGLATVAVALGAGFTVLLLGLCAMLAGQLAALFQTSGLWPVALLGPLLALVVCLQLTSGILLGAHKFAAFASTSVVEAGGRVIVTGPLVLLFGVSGSLGSYVVGQLAAIALAIVTLGGPAWLPPSREELATGARVGAAAFSLVAGVALLQHGDLIVLRWYGRPDDAGIYAACASVGTLLVAMAAPLYVPAFQRALAAYRANGSTLPIMVSALVPLLTIGVGASVGSVWLGGLVVGLSFGGAFSGATWILPGYLAKTTAVLAAGVIGQHALATGRSKAAGIAVPVSVGALLTLLVLQPGPLQAAVVMCVFAMLLAILLGILMLVGR
jgi:O-antigen/teichoic acid export membrane protein